MEQGGGEAAFRRPAAGAFWWRLTDNAFRRLPWLLVPVLALTVLGFMQARQTLELYESGGVLSTTGNPLIPEPEVAGTAARYWETAADATARTISEQLSTDAFIEEVAVGAGLGDAVEGGTLDLEIVRSSVWSYADGTSLVQVRASWEDPDTAFALVESTITAYQAFLAETVASDSSEAISFYTSQLADFRTEFQQAEDRLVEYVDGLPADRDPTLAETLQIERLTDAVRSAEDKVAAAEGNIEDARLTAAQAKSEAGRSLTVIDAPKVPTAPESTVVSELVTMLSYFLMGVVVAVAALLLWTVLDHSVATASDLLAVDGIDLVATAPTVRLGERTTKSTFLARRRAPMKRVPEAEPTGV